MLKLNYILLLLIVSSCSESDLLKKIFSFPNDLKEVSGIETVAGSDAIWVLEDSGNASEIYHLNSAGSIQQTLAISNVVNNDWEDLTSDAEGNLYIGDFGNNDNSRRDLAIYRIEAAQLKSKNASISHTVRFYFPEQTAFPPKKSERIFDVEAFFISKNFFYLFTKNRSSKFDGTTMLYKVPNTVGNHAAQLLGKFKTCETFGRCAITSADISPDGKRVALLSSAYVWVFTDFDADNFLSGKSQQIDLNHFSQKEGLCFKGNNTLLLCDEKKKKNGGDVYTLDLSN